MKSGFRFTDSLHMITALSTSPVLRYKSPQKSSGLASVGEAMPGFGVRGVFVRKEFEHKRAVGFLVLGSVDDSHPTVAQVFEILVTRNNLAD